ncbi:response regulator [Agarivorans litoreus]|uniref:response regulator n=1 Tax=Agarivorans litoreus TaxID=1510455 RepID=UPI001C7D1ABD|nr:response regulator [Agarivorans litoreus]
MPSFDPQRPALIIDDCPMYRTAARGMLQKLGVSSELIFFAKDAPSALEQCRNRRFQLVLCDYNLGEGANGHQLIDELRHSALLAADCVLAIVTADASAEVVRGFAELQPDGYLVKPLNFSNLSKRLPTIAHKKLSLARVHQAMAQQDYHMALHLVDNLVIGGSEFSLSALLIKAEALMHLGEYEQARNQLVGLNLDAEKGQVNLLLAELSLRQKQYPLAEALLLKLENDPMLCALAKEKMAIKLLRQQRVAEAYAKLEEALAHSPKNTQRQIFKAQLAMANFELPAAALSINAALHLARHSFRETLSLHQQVAQLTLDLAQFSEDNGQQSSLQRRFAEQCRRLRGRFQRKDYKPLELLMLARSNGIQGYIGKARQMLADYHSWLEQQEQHQPSVLEDLELAKVYQLLSFPQEYKAQLRVAQHSLLKLSDSDQSLMLQRYLSKWQERVDGMQAKANRLKEQSQRAYRDQNFERATGLLVQALELNRSDLEIPARLTTCLTKAWPLGWSKSEVIELALRCRELLKGSSLSSQPRYQTSSRALSGQLQVQELETSN